MGGPLFWLKRPCCGCGDDGERCGVKHLDPLDDLPPELRTASDMRAAEDSVITRSTPGITLMERVGVAIADVVEARFCGLRSAAVICGPGNNGGDGFVVAHLLEQRGVSTTVFTLVPREAFSGDAALVAARWRGTCQPLTEAASLDRLEIIFDALFGIGNNTGHLLRGGAAARLISNNGRFAWVRYDRTWVQNW
jgi:ADP-dependent NAD(P)H-hydrate dehydratase / NAD(P)H-hydrate epimerase